MAFFNFKTDFADPFGSFSAGARGARKEAYDQALKQAQITATFEKIKVARAGLGLRASLAKQRMELEAEQMKVNRTLAQLKLGLLGKQVKQFDDEAPYRSAQRALDLRQRGLNADRTETQNRYLDAIQAEEARKRTLGNDKTQKELDKPAPNFAPKLDGIIVDPGTTPAAPAAPAAPAQKGRVQRMSFDGGDGEDPLGALLNDTTGEAPVSATPDFLTEDDGFDFTSEIDA